MKNDWQYIPFAKAAKVISDEGKRVKQRDYLSEGKIPVIDQGQDFIGGYINDDTMTFKGDLPVIIFGDHTRNIKFITRPFAVGAEGVKILKPELSYEPKFFYYILYTLNIPSRGYSRHFQFLKKNNVPLISRPEQKLIVSEIEKQFSRLDEAVAGLKRIKANLKRYKASVLKAAVEGKLTEKWRKYNKDVEPAEKLLKRILTERKKKWEEKNPGKKYKEPVAPDTSNLPELPKGWVWTTVEVACEQIVDCPHSTPRFQQEGYPCIDTNWMTTAGLTIENSRFVDQTVYQERIARLVPKYGDIVFAREGTIGTAVIIPKHMRPCLGQRVMLLRASGHLSGKLLMHTLHSEVVRAQYRAQALGSTVPHINVGDVKHFAIPIPPLPEQHCIVAEVDRLFSVSDEIEAAVETNLKRAERLQQGF